MILVTLPTERVSWNYFMYSNRIFYESHAPHGACELKSPMTHWQADKSKSRSPRSVWVEIVIFKMPKYLLYRHAPHGACELKSCTIALHTFYCIVTLPTERVSWNWTVFFRCYRSLGHAPHGACELKLIVSIWGSLVAPSRSPRSVWVEITRSRPKILSTSSRSPRSVWVEIYEMPVIRPPETGHAPHGACELKL